MNTWPPSCKVFNRTHTNVFCIPYYVVSNKCVKSTRNKKRTSTLRKLFWVIMFYTSTLNISYSFAPSLIVQILKICDEPSMSKIPCTIYTLSICYIFSSPCEIWRDYLFCYEPMYLYPNAWCWFSQKIVCYTITFLKLPLPSLLDLTI